MKNILDEVHLTDPSVIKEGYPEIDHYPSEEIAGLRFCSSLEPPVILTVGPSRRVALAILLTTSIILALGVGLVNLIFRNPLMGGKIAGMFGMVLYVGMYALLFGVQIANRKKNLGQPELPPFGVPADALPVRVSSLAADLSCARTVGWIWVSGSNLCFRGIHFGFRLQSSDFKQKLTHANLAGPLRLRLPKAFPSCAISVHRRFISGDRWEKWTWRERFSSELEAWRSSAQTSEPRLYPPVRCNRRFARVGLGLLQWAAIGFAVSMLFAAFCNAIPPEIRSDPLPVYLAITLIFPVMFGMTTFFETLNRKSGERALKAAASLSCPTNEA